MVAGKSSDGDVGGAGHHSGIPRWIALLSLLVLIGAGVAWWTLHARPQPEQQTATAASGARNRPGRRNPALPIPVQVATTRHSTLHQYLESLGTVTSANSVIVNTRVDGLLLKLNFREGQTVHAGQVLAELDPASFQASLKQAEGQMLKDQALLDNARRDLQRYQMLLKQDSTSQQQVDTTESLVHQYEGTVRSDQGELDSARLDLDYTRVRAPVSGRLGLRAVDPGNMVHTTDSSGIVTINQMSPIDIVFTLTEMQLPMVLEPFRNGQKLLVEAWDRSLKQKLAEGQLVSMDNQIDQTTGTVKLKARFENADEHLFPNQFVNIRLLAKTLSNVVVIPSAALQRGRDGTFVYVVDKDDRVHQTPVKTGVVDGLDIQVTHGLQGSETVVTDGIDQLHEGTRIEIANPGDLLKKKPRHSRHAGSSSAKSSRSTPSASESAHAAEQ